MIQVYPVIPMLIQTLIARVHYEPSAKLDEYAKMLEDQFDVTVSKARLSQIFAKYDINLKKVFFPWVY